MRLRSMVRWRTKKQRCLSTSLRWRVSLHGMWTLLTSPARSSRARMRASILSVFTCASAMMRVLKALASVRCSPGMACSKTSKSQCQFIEASKTTRGFGQRFTSVAKSCGE